MLAQLKKDIESARAEVVRDQKPGATEAELWAAYHRYCEKSAILAHRALVLAKAFARAPEAPEALVCLLRDLGGYHFGIDAERDAAYDLLAAHYLDSDVILPVVRMADWDACITTHAEPFLRAAAGKSPNLKVKALACFTLGRLHDELLEAIRDLEHPNRLKVMEKSLGPENIRRLRTLNTGELRREAEALYQRTIKEFANVRPMGKDFPPLGEQADGALFHLRNLGIGRTVPEIEGEDIEGKPMRLSEFRGKVVVISFWATWCGPCMGMVPHEKALVERMKGRPFVLIGVNGDDDRNRAKVVAAKEGINWRSFWDGGRQEGVAVKWGIRVWPTVYLIDDQGRVRDESTALRGHDLDQAVDSLVAEAEAAKRP